MTMCLAVPGRIVAIASEVPAEAHQGDHPSELDLWRMATVDFGGVRQSVSLACLSEARLGDLVLVHVGLAICRVEEALEEPTLDPVEELGASRRGEPIAASLASRPVQPRADRTEPVVMSLPVAPSVPFSRPLPDATAPGGADRMEAQS
jgi:hydrogenase expression/formation protein HypC